MQDATLKKAQCIGQVLCFGCFQQDRKHLQIPPAIDAIQDAQQTRHSHIRHDGEGDDGITIFAIDVKMQMGFGKGRGDVIPAEYARITGNEFDIQFIGDNGEPHGDPLLVCDAFF